jgi:phage shock protein A
MGPLEILVMRLVLWIGLPLLLLSLAVGPRRVLRQLKAGWKWFTRRRLDPEEILTHVVRQHEQHVAALGKLLAEEEASEADIVANLRQSEGNLSTLEEQAHTASARGDELGALAALYKLNLERAAMENFGVQLKRQRELIEDSRRRLYELELQLRQYEVGRNILLSQLAAAEKVEQQYAIARQFDPFNAVANWQQAEGLVQQKSLNAKAIERVYADTTDAASAATLSSGALSVDPAAFEAELARLRGKARGTGDNAGAGNGATNGAAGENGAAGKQRPTQDTK